jgi:hypothetical protein
MGILGCILIIYSRELGEREADSFLHGYKAIPSFFFKFIGFLIILGEGLYLIDTFGISWLWLTLIYWVFLFIFYCHLQKRYNRLD